MNLDCIESIQVYTSANEESRHKITLTIDNLFEYYAESGIVDTPEARVEFIKVYKELIKQGVIIHNDGLIVTHL